MAGSLIKLTVDRQNKALIGQGGSATTIKLFQSDTFTLQTQVVDPTGVLAQYSTFDAGAAGYTLRLWIGPTPQGSSSQTPIVFITTFTWDPVNKWFTGDVAMNTTPTATLLGTNPSSPVTFELHLVKAADLTTILEAQPTLYASGDKNAAVVPTSDGNTFLNKADILGLLDSKLDKLIKSPLSVYGREIGIADDGTPTDNIVVL